jgi:hypothetical protein
MPHSTASQIQQEFAVQKLPVQGISGRNLKNKFFYKSGKANIRGREVELAVLIIQARARAGSKYNSRTGSRWQIPEHPFKGLPRALQHQKMAALIDRMIKGRDSSTHFLAAGFIAPTKAFAAAMGRFHGSGGKNMPGGKESRSEANLGAGIPAKDGTYLAIGRILNLIGTQGKNAASMNRALFMHGEPTLQRAIDREGQAQMDWAMKKFVRDNSQAVNKHWK